MTQAGHSAAGGRRGLLWTSAAPAPGPTSVPPARQPWPLGLPVPPTPEQMKDRTEKCSGWVREAPLALPHPPRPWG